MILKEATYRKVPYTGLHPRQGRRAAILHTNGFDPGDGSLFRAWSNQAAAGSTKGTQFQVKMSGAIEQYVDTALVVYHAFDASEFAVGIETEDKGDCHQPWLDAQVAGILVVLRALGVPGKLLDEGPSDGVGYHRQYPSWNKNGHECPCDDRQQQIMDVIIPALAGGGGDDLTPAESAQLAQVSKDVKAMRADFDKLNNRLSGLLDGIKATGPNNDPTKGVYVETGEAVGRAAVATP